MSTVIVIGSGGREHALAWSLHKSDSVSRIICAPGNAGTAAVAQNVHVRVDDHDTIVALALREKADLVVIGPEAPLCAGLVDLLEREGVRAFGPTAAAARIEGDKAYAKQLMKVAKVPTAEARIFDDYHAARTYVASRDTGVVVKASGLAAGKGVSVCPDPAQALLELERIMVDKAFGDAGKVVVVEEMLKGQELSVLALVDGRTIYLLETAQDHKAALDGDQGPNTGGMGAYSPAPIATPDVMAVVEEDVLVPIVDALRSHNAPYRGVLYAGLMITPGGPKVLEFNCRFGDPEIQAVLARLDSDLYAMLHACVNGDLENYEVKWRSDASVCVVMASEGYPGPYRKGDEITGLDLVAAMDDVQVFHAGTRKADGRILTAGGRVLGVTATAPTIGAAADRAYEAVSKIAFKGAHYRTDIAARAR